MSLAISFGVIDFFFGKNQSIFEETGVDPNLHDGGFTVKYFYFCVALDSDIWGRNDNGFSFWGFVFRNGSFDGWRPFDGISDPFLGAITIKGELNAGFENASQFWISAKLDGGDLPFHSSGDTSSFADLLKVTDVTALTGNGDTLLVVGTHGTVEGHGVQGLGEVSHIHHVGADDDSRSSFARLAMNGCTVAWISAEIFVDIAAHSDQQLQRWWIVIIERVLDHIAIKLGRVVVSLTAQVVKAVMSWVTSVQESLGVDPGVPVECFFA